MVDRSLKANKGEWSELYAFLKILIEGKLYPANSEIEKDDNVFLPITKVVRKEDPNDVFEYVTGSSVKIFKNRVFVGEVSNEFLANKLKTMYDEIFQGNKSTDSLGSFSISGVDELMEKLHLKRIKASSSEKIDINLQIHDISTGFEHEVGFSIKSEIGSPPTLLNSGKNTRIRYKVKGISEDQVSEINSIDKTYCHDYMVERMKRILQSANGIEFVEIRDEVFNENLIMIDSLMPKIYGEMVLMHYREMSNKISDCGQLITLMEEVNPLRYRFCGVYEHKFKKLVCSSALGMTPGKKWNGIERANGGYIIIKRNGDVLCYHLYNRNLFEEYLLRNTKFDRPSPTRHEFGYLYKEGSDVFLDLNVQIRFSGKRKENLQF